MSVELNVYLRRERLPTRDIWQQTIADHGIDLQLEDLNTTSHTGFWPVKLGKTDCGFEYRFDRVDEEEPEEILAGIGDRDHCASFRWHSSLDDCRAAAFSAGALALVADGVLFDPQSGDMAEGASDLDLTKTWFDT